MEVMALATATARGLLMPMPMPGMDTVVFTATVSQPMADTAMLDTARGLLTLRLTPGMDMEDSMVTDSQPMVVTDTDCGARRRGLPMLRPSLRLMLGLDMVDSMATVLVWAMAAMAMEVLATDMERGLGYAYGKRSADAKPEADAWYGYGGLYGYGLPAYGGYGYGLWGKK